MVGAGQPEGAVALHALEPDERILIGLVERMAHVQLSRYVGRGHHYGEGDFIVVPLSAEAPLLLPLLVNFVLK